MILQDVDNAEVAVGVVVIGRNEGHRLVSCLESVISGTRRVVYVDSGSNDGSIQAAQRLGVYVVELDTSFPFTAGRARNQGFSRILDLWPDTDCVQMIDGDCELFSEWLHTAAAVLNGNMQIAAVCGKLNERRPTETIYNRIAQLEWDSSVGEVETCGGVAMYRSSVFKSVGGFRESMIAGEEPELCLRIRQSGFRIHKHVADMAWHDIDMTRFSQFWKRAKRTGHAYAEGAALHGRGPDRHGVRAVRSALVWGLLIPVLALLMVWPTWGLSLLAFAGLLTIQIWRIRRNEIAMGRSPDDAILLAVAVMVAKPAQALGVLRYWRRRLLGQRPSLIEYKQSSVPSAGDAPYV